eukprot:10137839-Alexandrium_andersonii.AAC.1
MLGSTVHHRSSSECGRHSTFRAPLTTEAHRSAIATTEAHWSVVATEGSLERGRHRRLRSVAPHRSSLER